MHIRVKICGVTTEDAVRAAVDAGAAAVGFVFAESPRRVDVDRARELAAELPPSVMRVAVFRHPDPRQIRDVIDGFAPDLVQSEPDEPVVRALGRQVRLLPVLHDEPRVVDRARELKDHSAVLLEGAGRGGRGIAPDRRRAAEVARTVPLVLAGGLDPENVADAIRQVRPVGVDVSSGVESRPGVKDPELITRFIAAVRRAEEVAS